MQWPDYFMFIQAAAELGQNQHPLNWIDIITKIIAEKTTLFEIRSWVTLNDVNKMSLGSTKTFIKCLMVNSNSRPCKTTIPG